MNMKCFYCTVWITSLVQSKTPEKNDQVTKKFDQQLL